MAIVKAKAGKGSLSDVFNYVLDKEKTDDTLISSKDCMAETAQKEFELTKHRFGKTDGRTYFHIVQSFSPDDDLTPETAHEIGLKFAEYFPGFQIVVATHVNTNAIHNHLIMNSVNYENGMVASESSSRKARRISASVAVSTALVESSRIRIFGFFSNALAIQRRCF